MQDQTIFILFLAGLAFMAGYLLGRRGPLTWRRTLKATAREAVRYADGLNLTNPERLNAAVDRVGRKLSAHGVLVDPVLVRGAVEIAYREWKLGMMTPNEETKP